MNLNRNKILSLLISIIMLLSFVGCEIDSYKNITQNNNSFSDSDILDKYAPGKAESQENQKENAESTEASKVTIKPTAKPTIKPTSTPKVTEKPTAKPVTFKPVNPKELPAYSGTPYTIINANIPLFSDTELSIIGYEKYSPLDKLGRCSTAIASCGLEIMPDADEERGNISDIKPTGWIQAKYEGISGGYLWNRCHLIGWQLSAENANKQNLITGTRYMNVNGMLPFENMVADYIKETGNHVAYRITPIFVGNNLVCSGVQMEAYSIEDEGEGISFNIYCYNVQPGITINYATGESSSKNTPQPTTAK